MTGQQLKNSILQMAVQGKLVPQDLNDEPASVLLERIRKEKEHFIKEGKIKKEKNPSYIFRGVDNLPYEKVGTNEPVCIADEVPFEIPESWEWVRLGSVLDIARGGSPRPIKDYLTNSPDGINWIKIGDTDKGGKYICSTKEKIKPEGISKSRMVYEGDFLLTNSMSFGRPYILKTRGCIHDGWLVLSNQYQCYSVDFLYYLLSSAFAYNQFSGVVSGAVVKNLNSDKVAAALFPLPPIEEQERIVLKIEEIIPLIENYDCAEMVLSSMQKNFPAQLKKSILQMAVQGKLVPQDPNDEPASVLLERIRAEKQRLVKEGKIKKDKHESVIFRRDNSHYEKCGSKEINIDEIIPFDLPDSWEWIRLSTILTSTDAGKSPQCENRPRSNYEWGVIKTTAIQDGYFLADENKVLPINFNIQESMMVHSGDLLITRAGPRNRTGVICVVDGEPENLILSDKTVRLSYLRGFVNPYYIMTALSSPAMQYFVIDSMTGMATSQVNISQEKMKTFLLPLPPFNEQQRIVEEVEKIFEHIGALKF
ncbi:restriction endonuclease subunit S [[Clostridium] scindens]|uniref:restriction endonuclease subunit S n=1 Tax=Clostridium scindens (strain JCM 10418 / VPI 12708) TaxID=29347 RepID=UPI000471EBD5|nr:restriction endonuclease subunit S [[Clostridium] scindens]MCB6287267.1 restriction endonuclease subunit S [[Clostridium] scindens]MCB6421960.1 restriction endonuclease subunit S [[Clostridium] scindens]MCB7193708.1 restriction endonuclease subunit S [[Clostridium] scindens]MCB7286773.1 restriction endonuclease subunit S [[Clostridium] scindens]MCG4930179.1 restriction endonuclease subunit S [[Clostridium] scindens]